MNLLLDLDLGPWLLIVLAIHSLFVFLMTGKCGSTEDISYNSNKELVNKQISSMNKITSVSLARFGMLPSVFLHYYAYLTCVCFLSFRCYR